MAEAITTTLSEGIVSISQQTSALLALQLGEQLMHPLKPGSQIRGGRADTDAQVMIEAETVPWHHQHIFLAPQPIYQIG